MRRIRASLRAPFGKRLSISSADRVSWGLFLFSGARCVAWVLLLVCVALGMLGVSALSWARHAAEGLAFVTLISLYANAASDFNGMTSAWAAIRAGAAHAQVASTESGGLVGTAEILSAVELVLDEVRRQERD